MQSPKKQEWMQESLLEEGRHFTPISDQDWSPRTRSSVLIATDTYNLVTSIAVAEVSLFMKNQDPVIKDQIQHSVKQQTTAAFFMIIAKPEGEIGPLDGQKRTRESQTSSSKFHEERIRICSGQMVNI